MPSARPKGSAGLRLREPVDALEERRHPEIHAVAAERRRRRAERHDLERRPRPELADVLPQANVGAGTKRRGILGRVHAPARGLAHREPDDQGDETPGTPSQKNVQRQPTASTSWPADHDAEEIAERHAEREETDRRRPLELAEIIGDHRMRGRARAGFADADADSEQEQLHNVRRHAAERRHAAPDREHDGSRLRRFFVSIRRAIGKPSVA